MSKRNIDTLTRNVNAKKDMPAFLFILGLVKMCFLCNTHWRAGMK